MSSESHLITLYVSFLESNGLDEHFNQTVQSILVKFVNKRKSNWDEHAHLRITQPDMI